MEEATCVRIQKMFSIVTINSYSILFQIHHETIDQFLTTFNVMSSMLLEIITMVHCILMNVVFQSKEMIRWVSLPSIVAALGKL